MTSNAQVYLKANKIEKQAKFTQKNNLFYKIKWILFLLNSNNLKYHVETKINIYEKIKLFFTANKTQNLQSWTVLYKNDYTILL